MNQTDRPVPVRDGVAIVVGAGDATGGALARRFAREGLKTVICRRDAEKLETLADEIRKAGGSAWPRGCDARCEEEVIALFDWAEAELGPVEVAIFNVGGNVRAPFREIDAKKFFKVWEMACLAGFLTLREAARRMVPRGRGTIIATGASASRKGYAGGAMFASAKFALRGLTQALAREVGAQGIHVAHVVIDGAIDTEFIRTMFPERYELKDREGLLQPEAIADIYWQIHCQPRTAWTHETELRPWIESW